MPDKPSTLSLAQKLAYGAGDFGPAVTANLLVFFWLLLTTTVGLEIGVASSILAVSKLWDAVNDPLIGILTDRTRSRWGRRRPWLLFGAVPFGLAFFGQWLVPFPGQPGASFVYYLVLTLVFNSLYTAVNLPYTALTPELTDDYDERTSLSNFRFAFSIGGSILSGVSHPLILQYFSKDPVLGHMVSAGFWTVLCVLPLFWCFAGTRERFSVAPQTALSLAEQLRIAFANRSYLLVAGIYLCSWLAVQIIATVLPFYVTFYMRLSQAWLAGSILAIQGTAFLMLFVWTRASERIGKRNVYFIGAGFMIAAVMMLTFLQPGQEVAMLVVAVIAGVGVSTAYLIPWSMLPDVIDQDELETGERREGIFYALLVLLQKLCLALGILLVGVALESSGFDQRVLQQPESALLALRAVIGPAPALALVLGIYFAWLYPLSRELHREILATLEERRTQAQEKEIQPGASPSAPP